MKIGTRSILFGVHQFILHPFFVTWAWRITYSKWPSWKELVAIFLHDVGYLGKPNMDGVEGEQHPRVGAAIASRWLGGDYGDMVLRHSRAMARSIGMGVSKLCLPDKMATLMYPTWLYLSLATMSGEIHEYKERMKMTHLSHEEWLDEVRLMLYRWAHENADSAALARIQARFGARMSQLEVQGGDRRMGRRPHRRGAIGSALVRVARRGMLRVIHGRRSQHPGLSPGAY